MPPLNLLNPSTCVISIRTGCKLQGIYFASSFDFTLILLSQMSAPRSKRNRRMSKRRRRALDLPSDASDPNESSTSGDGETDAGSHVSEATVATRPFMRSQSTASFTSQVSGFSAVSSTNSLALVGHARSTAGLAPRHSVDTAKTDDQRRARFAERYNTATSSDDNVLSRFLLIVLCA